MSVTWSGTVTGSVAVTHDSFFRVASRAVSGGTPVVYAFDADGLYVGASGLVTLAHTRDFSGANGLLTGSTLDAVTDSLTYNGFGELADYDATHGTTTLYASTVSARDANGRVTNASETLAATTHAWTYAYDAHGNLASATEDGANTSFTYDTNGNRLSAGGQTSTYDAQDRLLTGPGATYAYSNNGDLKTKVTSAGSTTYAYDLLGALRSVSLPSGDFVKYVIDGQERRVGRVWEHGTQRVTQSFLYDDQLHIAAELDGQGTVVSTFVYGMRPNVPDAMVRGGSTYRILSDWRGSVRAVVDANLGTVVQTIDYDAWGNPTVNDASCASGAVCALFQPFGFAGGLYDRETGLVRFGARDYDAVSGRWTQKDASGFEGGTNFYAYAGNDPTNFYDPDGHFSVACAAAGAFGEGVAGGVYNFSKQAFNAAQNSFCGGNTSINWGEVAGAVALGAVSGALRGACFEAGTLVATCSDGEQPIETLKEGDQVLSRNDETGETECKAVVRTYVHDADDVARLSMSADGGRVESLDVTLGHPFWVAGKGWTSVRDLVRGEALATAAGNARVWVDGWVAESTTQRVFNLEIEGDHSYFVGADGVWVHNDCGRTELPALDSTGKVHGALPRPQDLGQYGADELAALRDDLEQSVQQRIGNNVLFGPDLGHGERQGAEQLLSNDPPAKPGAF